MLSEVVVRERFLRIEAIRRPTAEIALLLETSEKTLARWIAGSLKTDEEDVIEVGLSLLERPPMRAFVDDDEPTAQFATVRVA